MATRFAEPEPWIRVAAVLAEAAGVSESRSFDDQALALAKTMRGVRHDWAGKPTITWTMAAELLASLRAEQARVVAEIEQRAIEADRAFRASLPSGVPVGMVPEGMTAVQLVMSADPMFQAPRRESPLEHALNNRGGAVFHPIRDEQASQ